MLAVITDAFRYSNYIEGFVWLAVGGLSLVAASQRAHPRLGVALLFLFSAFGISDWVESTTGAWWSPWWLLAWKAACVIAVVGLLIRAKFARPISSQPAATPPQ